MGLNYRIFKCIDAVPKYDWDIVSSSFSIMYTHSYWNTIEKSKINGFYNFNYIIIYHGNKPVGTAVAYTIEEDLSASSFKKLAGFIRKFYKRFLTAKILLCGSPLNILPYPLCYNGIKYEDALVEVQKALKEISLAEKCLFIGIQEISYKAKDTAQAALDRFGYLLVETRPNSKVNIAWNSIDEYLLSMKSYYRSKLNNHLRKCKKRDVSCKVAVNFHSISDVLAKQWENVHSKSTVMSREKLNEEFYSSISKSLEGASKVLLFYSGKNLIAHALLVLDGKVLRWLYIGREIAANDSLYFYIFFKIIEYAIEHEFETIECGPSVYRIKQEMGAKIENIFMALKIRIPKSKFFLKLFYEKKQNFNIPSSKKIFKQRENQR